MALIFFVPTKDEADYIDEVIAREAREAKKKDDRPAAERMWDAVKSAAGGS